MTRTAAQEQALQQLTHALRECDGRLAEEALVSAWRDDGACPDLADVLIALAEEPWHAAHEDIVLLLQLLRPPQAVPVLERVALTSRAHLPYDNSAALARKCTWALADIGTADAYAALERLARAKKRHIRVYAWKRITEWAREMPRKPAGSYAPSGSKDG